MMTDEPSNAVLAERLNHVILRQDKTELATSLRLDRIEAKQDLLLSAYQQAKGAKWMFSILKGLGLIGVGTGIVKAVEALSASLPPYHP